MVETQQARYNIWSGSRPLFIMLIALVVGVMYFHSSFPTVIPAIFNFLKPILLCAALVGGVALFRYRAKRYTEETGKPAIEIIRNPPREPKEEKKVVDNGLERRKRDDSPRKRRVVVTLLVLVISAALFAVLLSVSGSGPDIPVESIR